MPERPLVLDTHVWIWTVNGDPTITLSTRQRISLALQRSRVLIPAICVWEVAMLWKKNRIQLREPLLDWVKAALEKSGFSLMPITDTIAAESALLPGKFHNDPADSMIVATARLEKAILITRDCRMIQYGLQGHVDTFDA